MYTRIMKKDLADLAFEKNKGTLVIILKVTSYGEERRQEEIGIFLL